MSQGLLLVLSLGLFLGHWRWLRGFTLRSSRASGSSQGVTITRELSDRPYGCRDFDVEDCNGYRLCVGHTLE